MFLRLIIALCVFPVLLTAASVEAPGVDPAEFQKQMDHYLESTKEERERKSEEQWLWWVRISALLLFGAVAVLVSIRKQLKQSPPPRPAGMEKQAETDTEPRPPRTYDY